MTSCRSKSTSNRQANRVSGNSYSRIPCRNGSTGGRPGIGPFSVVRHHASNNRSVAGTMTGSGAKASFLRTCGNSPIALGDAPVGSDASLRRISRVFFLGERARPYHPTLLDSDKTHALAYL